MKVTNILNEVNQVLAVLVLYVSNGEAGLGEVKDAIVAGEGAAPAQRDGDASIKLGRDSGGKCSERDGSEQGGLAEHGANAGGGSDRTAEILRRGCLMNNLGLSDNSAPRGGCVPLCNSISIDVGDNVLRQQKFRYHAVQAFLSSGLFRLLNGRKTNVTENKAPAKKGTARNCCHKKIEAVTITR